MGSGLILLLIVGAWLAVLVPMALRSHEASSALSTVDRFHDAMRVLSRRQGGQSHGRAPSDAPAEPGAPPAGRKATDVPQRPQLPRLSQRRERPRLTAAARRRRAVGVLLLVAVVSFVGGLVGPFWLMLVHALADLLLVGTFTWLRRQALLRSEREARTVRLARRAPEQQEPEPSWSPLPQWSPADRPAPAPVAVPGQAPVYGIPDRMPTRASLVSTDSVFDQALYDGERSQRRVVGRAPLRQVPAAREAEQPRPRGAKGEPWSPVPVPVPTYVTAPRAPRRVLDLTAPARTSPEALASAERSPGIDDQGPELEHILGRRAVGD